MKKTITLSKFGSRHEKKVKRYSDSFNEIFSFYLACYRKGLITFCGSKVGFKFSSKGFNGKESFRKFDIGEKFETKHPNILKAIVTAKKGFGLWIDQWSEGISECSFQLEEILEEFSKRGIKIPDAFMQDFQNRIQQKKYLKYLRNYK